MAININAKTSGVGGLETTADNSGNINIQSGGSTVMSVTSSGVAVTGSFSQNGAVYSTQPSFRNLIINGDMRIDQRNAGASVTPVNAQYLTDRFSSLLTQSSKFTAQQSSTAPSNFTKSLVITSSSAYSVLTGDAFGILQKIEGNNIAHLGWGTSDAKTVTLSFYVRSSLTGTFGGAILNEAVDRSYPFSYTISSADTWERKTITIVGDTTGTWDTDNTLGMQVHWGLGVGSTYSGTSGSWAGAYYLSATGATSVVGTSGATFYITGVQLEVGSTATDFENLPYDVSLARCQRYYYKEQATFAGQYFAPNAYAIGTTSAFTFNTFPVPMRTRPTALEQSGTASDYSLVRCGAGTFTICNSVPTFGGSSLTIGQCVFNVASGLSNGFAGSGMSQSTNAYLAWSAEL